MKDKERKNRFNKEVSELKCNEQLEVLTFEEAKQIQIEEDYQHIKRVTSWWLKNL